MLVFLGNHIYLLNGLLLVTVGGRRKIWPGRLAALMATFRGNAAELA